MRETEPHMRMFIAQIFEGMRRKVDDDQPPTGTQHARGFRKRDFRLVEEMQDLMDNNQIEILSFQRQIENIAMTDRGIDHARLVEIGTRHRQHVTAGIDADRAAIDAAQKLQDTAGAGAQIEKRIDRRGAHQLQERAFHGLVTDMQATQLVPGGSIAAEIILRPLRPHPLDSGKPFTVTLENGIRRRRGAKQLPNDARRFAILPQTEIGPCAFLITLDKPLFRQKLEVTGDTRLRLAEDFGKIGNRQIACRQKRKQAKACRLTRRFQQIHQFVQTERHSAVPRKLIKI
ncbi:hypothetical protein D3C72_1219210 [compost metagenome]